MALAAKGKLRTNPILNFCRQCVWTTSIFVILWQVFIPLLVLPGLACAEEMDRGAVPILLYHRFGSAVTDSMTVRTRVFASHLEYLKANGYTVIPLRQLIDYIADKAPAPPARSVVITADDGHESVFTEMFPLISRYHIPVTLFIYPSAISNASYAMTWQQLREMQAGGLVDIQSHTYWHPNFIKEKKRLAADAYEQFVDMQMSRSKQVLEQRVGGRVDMLAWPFGIYNDELINSASQAGYVAAFTLERRPAVSSDQLMALPRYLMTDQVRFEKLLAESSHPERRKKP